MILELKQKGFTLIEMLIYLGIFLLVTTASVTFLISLDDVIREYRIETALYRSSTNVLEQVQLALRQADTFDTLGSITASSTGVLSVDSGTTTTEFARVGDSIIMTVNGTTLGNLVTNVVEVTNFTVYHYPVSIGEAARVELGLTATIGSTTKSATFYTGSVIRDSI